MNLETTYMGLKLKSPIIVSSSSLTNSIEKIKLIEKNEAGAVILKSLFEEQIDSDVKNVAVTSQNEYPEAEDYIKNYIKDNTIGDYLKLIEDCKKEVNIPIIASINCVSNNDWTDFAKKIEKAGADAIELNINLIPTDPDVLSYEYEQIYLNIFESVKKKVNIPVGVKIGYHFTNLLYIVNQLHFRKADSITLFNRFYEPDIDIESLKIISSEVLSTPNDIRQSLRWIGILSDKIEGIEISASTGIHNGNTAIKQLLAGAQTLQICSTLYIHGIEYIQNINEELQNWMKKNSFKKIDDFRGKLNYSKIGNPRVYERSQFMRYFSNKD